MAKIYGFPEGGRAGVSASFKRKPGRISAWLQRTAVTYYLKRSAANLLHYPVMAVLLLVMKVRYPVAVLGGGYCMYFLSTHHNSLWVSENYSALYALLAVCAALLSFVVVNLMESYTPFHRLFGARRNNKCMNSANDDLNESR